MATILALSFVGKILFPYGYIGLNKNIFNDIIIKKEKLVIFSKKEKNDSFIKEKKYLENKLLRNILDHENTHLRLRNLI